MIIDSLTAGVVPSGGVQHIVVGRSQEAAAIVECLNHVAEGQNVMKFWIGDFGSGKSFMFHLMKVLALKMKFVVASADFTPDTRLYSNDGKSLLLYRQLMSNLAIQTKPEGGALATLIEKWIAQQMTEAARENNIPISQLQKPEYQLIMEQRIATAINALTDSTGFEVGMAISRYYEGYVTGDDQLRKSALKWLQGEFASKTEARQALGVHEIVNDRNYFDVLKCLGRLFVSMGYAGLMINLDEAINLYKIPLAPMREKNYEKLLGFYNECYQGQSHNLFINIAGTKEFLTNERRGLYCYDALRSRLQVNKYAVGGVRDFSQPVIMLEPIGMEDILILLKNLRDIFNFRHGSDVRVTDGQIVAFMEELYNRPGASEFLLPRDVIRDFLNIMNALRQNPGLNYESLVKSIEVRDERPLDEIVPKADMDSRLDMIQSLDEEPAAPQPVEAAGTEKSMKDDSPEQSDRPKTGNSLEDKLNEIFEL